LSNRYAKQPSPAASLARQNPQLIVVFMKLLDLTKQDAFIMATQSGPNTYLNTLAAHL
jgi:hypothetical protein